MSGMICDEDKEARFRWFRHFQRRERGYVGGRMLKTEPPGRRERGRPKRTFMEVIREDMQIVGVREEDAEDGKRWRRNIHSSDS